MVHAEADQVLQVGPADVRAGRGPPGDGQHPQPVLKADRDLPMAVLAPAHRHEAVISPASGLRPRDHLPESGHPPLPVDGPPGCVAMARVAHAVCPDGQIGPAIWKDTTAAVFQENSSRNILAHNMLKRNLLSEFGKSGLDMIIAHTICRDRLSRIPGIAGPCVDRRRWRVEPHLCLLVRTGRARCLCVAQDRLAMPSGRVPRRDAEAEVEEPTVEERGAVLMEQYMAFKSSS